MTIEIISGTNREGSRTLTLSKALLDIYREAGSEVGLIDLRTLPPELFRPEAYSDKPKAFNPFCERILEADGLVVVVPEYNGGFPGIIKLFIDMLPFPESFENKHVAFVGLAAGYFGGLRGVEQLQMIFAYRNAKLFNQRVFIPKVGNVLSEDKISSDKIKERLTQQATDFIIQCSGER